MNAALAAALAVLMFGIAFRVANLAPRARDVVAASRRALRVMSDPGLDDLAKEKAVQKASLHLLKRFAQIVLRSTAVLLAPALLLVGFEALGMVADERVYGLLLTWQGILASTVGFVLVSLVWR